jgi:hypothetical protein
MYIAFYSVMKYVRRGNVQATSIPIAILGTNGPIVLW